MCTVHTPLFCNIEIRSCVVAYVRLQHNADVTVALLWYRSWQEAALETHATAARPRVSVLGAALDELQEVNRAFHELAFDTVLAPLRLKLSTLSHIEVRMWVTGDAKRGIAQ